MTSGPDGKPVLRPSKQAVVSLALGGLACAASVLLAIPATQAALLTRVPAAYVNTAQVLLSVIGVCLGCRAWMQVHREPMRWRGKRVALAGVLVNLAATLVLLPAVMLGAVLPTLRNARSQQQSMSNLHAIVLALHKYHDEMGSFPPAAVFNYDGEPLYSWRVPLLPFLGYAQLYQQFHLDEAWDSPTNKALLAQMPQVYAPPGERFPPNGFVTSYLVFDGPDALFFSGSKPPWFDDELNRGRTPSFQVWPQRPGEQPVYAFGHRASVAAIMDGTMNTIMVVEANARVPWSKPEELAYVADQPLPSLGDHYEGGFLVALADGSVRIIRKSTSESAIRSAITANGGEIPPADWTDPAE